MSDPNFTLNPPRDPSEQATERARRRVDASQRHRARMRRVAVTGGLVFVAAAAVTVAFASQGGRGHVVIADRPSTTQSGPSTSAASSSTTGPVSTTAPSSTTAPTATTTPGAMTAPGAVVSPPTNGPAPCGRRLTPASRYSLELTVTFQGPATYSAHHPWPAQATVTVHNYGTRSVRIDGHSNGRVLALTTSGEVASLVPRLETAEYIQSVLGPGKSMTLPAKLPYQACTPSGSDYLGAGNIRIAPSIDLVIPGAPTLEPVIGTSTVVAIS